MKLNKRNTILLVVGLILTIGQVMAADVFYPSAPAKPKLQFLQSINGDGFLNSGTSIYGDRFPGYTGTAAKDKNPLVKPFGTTFSGSKLYICDAAAHVVRIFDLKNKTQSKIEKIGAPVAIAVDSNDNKYIADALKHEVLVYNKHNMAISSIKAEKPVDVAVHGDKLYVLDNKAGQVAVYNTATLEEVNRIGTRGSSDGELFAPTSLTLDAEGNLYVSDTLNGRISKFDAAGKYISSMGELGDTIGTFARPKGIALDKDNNLYAVDGGFENVQIFNKDQKLLMFFGTPGNDKGGLNVPTKITIDYNNVDFFKGKVAKGYNLEYIVLVSSNFGKNKVNVYGFITKK